jgi:eukaryotic-like serine/threonine-protein kinase
MNRNDHPLADVAENATTADIEAVRVFDAYLAEIQAGRPADPDRLLAEHPALAERLREFLNVTHIVDRVAGEPEPALEDYRIIREIGRGGMGIVYEAEQSLRGRRVALKVLPSAAALDPRQLRRFQVEVTAAQLLSHRHIVPITSFGCERGVYFYAMQYIEGRDLAALIAELREAGGASVTGSADPNGIRSQAESLNAGASDSELSSVPLGSPAPTYDSGFFRKVAQWALQAAEALDHAHEQRVLHRDIKPSNLLIDVRGNLWVADWGLAQVQGEDGMSRTGDVLGTLRYMSPEQALAQRVVIDGRTDIYSLGVTLYELLTLHPAFEGGDRQDLLRRIAHEEPRRPRKLVPALPRDFETIVLKAISKEREDRYKSAQELADDLRRFLNGQPIQARQPGPVDLALRWARRHRRSVASAAMLLVIGVVGLFVGMAFLARAERRAVAARTLAEERAQTSKYESLMEQILRLRLTVHEIGWSTRAWDLIRQASRLRAHEEHEWRLQGTAAATLGDIDARPVKRFAEFGAHFVAFDRDGRRLLMSRTNSIKEPEQMLGTKLWADATQELIDLEFDGVGHVGFRLDGTPIGLVANAKAGTVATWDLAKKQILRSFDLPGRLTFEEPSQLSMLPDGSLVCAPVLLSGDQPALVIWNGETGRRLQQLPGKATCVAISPDRSLVAAGDEAGRITVWSLSNGRVEAVHRSGQSSIHCLAFGANRHSTRRDEPARTGAGWLLAAGDAGGTITVWDLGSGIPRSYCRGSYHDIYSVVFSPDATTLASAGRHNTQLWDSTTGRPLLEVPDGDYTKGLAFSPDGRRLAVANSRWRGVVVLEVDFGRGIQSLRGLKAQVARVIFSADGRQIAALSHDWRIAIWDAGAGQLTHSFDAPKGLVADNAALAFSADGRRFAVASGGVTSSAATMWDLDSGRDVTTWRLPPGLVDSLAFQPSGNLLSCRCETRDSRRGPFSDAKPREYPRVCRVRNLTGPAPTTPLAEFDEFNWAVDTIVAPQDGAFFVVVGRGGPDGSRVLNKVVDGATGNLIGVIPMTRTIRYSHDLPVDPSGKVLAISTSNDDSQRTLIAMPSLKMIGTMDCGSDGTNAVGPGGRLWSTIRANPLRISLRGHKERELTTLGLDSRSSALPTFSADGGRFAWGSAEGVVFVANLREVQRRLSEVGLGW